MITLTVPADPDSLAVVRTIIAGLGARAGLTLDDIDDAMIAAEEATLALLGHGATRVSITAAVTTGRIAVSASSDGDPTQWPLDGFDHGLGWRVLVGVAEAAGHSEAGTTPAVWFEKGSAAR